MLPFRRSPRPDHFQLLTFGIPLTSERTWGGNSPTQASLKENTTCRHDRDSERCQTGGLGATTATRGCNPPARRSAARRASSWHARSRATADSVLLAPPRRRDPL